MKTSVTYANIDIPTISMEMAGVSYVPFSGIFNTQVQPELAIIDLDFEFGHDPSFAEQFTPSIISHDSHFYFLSNPLDCKIYFQDNLFKVDCPTLKLKVWGKSKEEAISALNFSFHSLCINFADAPDEKLSSGAKRLRNKLRYYLA